jgi:hypothetical protein
MLSASAAQFTASGASRCSACRGFTGNGVDTAAENRDVDLAANGLRTTDALGRADIE